jgi:hypothetical protein
MINISFPGGAGGNWLLNLLCNESLPSDPTNFHKHNYKQIYKYSIKLVHELDITKFNYLYSGKSYFNFYLNFIYKCSHNDLDIFNQTDYKTYFLECVNSARFLCRFDQIYDYIFFNYDDLIDVPENFYGQLCKFQIKNSHDTISEEDFLLRRDQYIATCVNPATVKHNFDNMFWVCFVIGQLMNLNLVPQDFLIHEYQNQDRCKQFASDNYQRCTLTKIHDFDTNVFMPNLL